MVIDTSWFLNYSHMLITYQVLNYMFQNYHLKRFFFIDQMYENFLQNYKNKQYGIIKTLLHRPNIY